MFLNATGENFIPKSAQTIAKEIINNFNYQLRSNNIRTEDGTIVQIEERGSNITWLLALALGSVASDYDFNLQACAESFDFSLCSDEQLKNLLPLAGQTLSEGKDAYTTLKATSSSDETITINKGTLINIDEHQFAVDNDVEVVANGTATVTATSVTRGEYGITQSSVSKWWEDEIYPEIALTVTAYVDGKDAYSVEDARNAILSHKQILSSWNGIQEAIKSLPWVRDALAVFNYSYTTNITIGAVTVRPRKSCLFIYGTASEGDSAVARIWYEGFPMETEDTAVSGLIQDTEVYDNGVQQFKCSWYECEEIPIYIKIKYLKASGTSSDTAQASLREIMAKYQSQLTLGYTVTSSFLDRAFIGSSVTVVDTLVSKTNSDFSDSISVYPYQMPIIREENISFEEIS